MAIRVKSQWFKADQAKSAGETASVMAFIIWRLTQNMVKQMRQAKFDIDIGPQYFAFMAEVLVFLIQVVDRLVYLRLDGQQRLDFTTALVRRVAEIFEDSQQEWLGAPQPGAPSWRAQFIELCNAQGQAYAEFGFDGLEPDFGFVRYLGSRLEAVVPPKDRPWVIEQLMASEVPDALPLLRRGLEGALASPGERAKRARVSDQ